MPLSFINGNVMPVPPEIGELPIFGEQFAIWRGELRLSRRRILRNRRRIILTTFTWTAERAFASFACEPYRLSSFDDDGS